VREGEMVVRRLALADGSPQQGGKAASDSEQGAGAAWPGRTLHSCTEADAQGQTRSFSPGSTVGHTDGRVIGSGVDGAVSTHALQGY
jgi:hypothetical protein